jgi:hypothetical protein
MEVGANNDNIDKPLQTFEEHLIKRIDDISTSAERLS